MSPSRAFIRSSKWKRVRRMMFRLITKCEICGHGDDLQVHHVKSRKQSPELAYAPHNLRVLCKACHERIHHVHQ